MIKVNSKIMGDIEQFHTFIYTFFGFIFLRILFRRSDVMSFEHLCYRNVSTRE